LRLSSLAAQLGVPEPVAHPLLAGSGFLISGGGLLVTFLRPVITVTSEAVALCGLGIAVAGRVIPGIAGLAPDRRIAPSWPGALLLPGGHPLPQQRRGPQYRAAQRIRPKTGGQYFQQPGQRHGFILTQETCPRPRNESFPGGGRSLFSRLLCIPGSALPPLGQPASQLLAHHLEGGALRPELGGPPDQLIMPVVHRRLPSPSRG